MMRNGLAEICWRASVTEDAADGCDDAGTSGAWACATRGRLHRAAPTAIVDTTRRMNRMTGPPTDIQARHRVTQQRACREIRAGPANRQRESSSPVGSLLYCVA